MAAAAGLVAVNLGVILASGPAEGTGFRALPEATTRTEISRPGTGQQGAPIADLPGRPEDTSRVREFPDVAELDYLTEPEVGAYRDGRPSTARMALHRDGRSSIIVLIVRMDGASAADAVRDRVHFIQRVFGLTATAEPEPGVLTSSTDAAPGRRPLLRRAHFTAGSQVVRVEVSGTEPTDVDDTFSAVLRDELAVLPADGT
ncbi:MAG: hypothetical protein ACRDSL_13075 [Pseudonocardiaceae bacterium]